MEFIKWNMASLAASRERNDNRPVAYLENEAGMCVGLMRKDILSGRWDLPNSIVMQLAVVEGYQGAIRHAPDGAKEAIFRGMLVDLSSLQEEVAVHSSGSAAQSAMTQFVFEQIGMAAGAWLTRAEIDIVAEFIESLPIPAFVSDLNTSIGVFSNAIIRNEIWDGENNAGKRLDELYTDDVASIIRAGNESVRQCGRMIVTKEKWQGAHLETLRMPFADGKGREMVLGLTKTIKLTDHAHIRQ